MTPSDGNARGRKANKTGIREIYSSNPFPLTFANGLFERIVSWSDIIAKNAGHALLKAISQFWGATWCIGFEGKKDLPFPVVPITLQTPMKCHEAFNSIPGLFGLHKQFSGLKLWILKEYKDL